MVITGLAPHVTILWHLVVGSFVTHCRWNSVLEGLTLLTWPMEADQFITMELLVEEMGVAVKV